MTCARDAKPCLRTHTHTETGKKIKDGLENKRVVAKARKRAKLDLESVEYQLNGFRPVHKFLDHHGGLKKNFPHLAKNVTAWPIQTAQYIGRVVP